MRLGRSFYLPSVYPKCLDSKFDGLLTHMSTGIGVTECRVITRHPQIVLRLPPPLVCYFAAFHTLSLELILELIERLSQRLGCLFIKRAGFLYLVTHFRIPIRHEWVELLFELGCRSYRHIV